MNNFLCTPFKYYYDKQGKGKYFLLDKEDYLPIDIVEEKYSEYTEFALELKGI
jgi:hypothetical protein